MILQNGGLRATEVERGAAEVEEEAENIGNEEVAGTELVAAVVAVLMEGAEVVVEVVGNADLGLLKFEAAVMEVVGNADLGLLELEAAVKEVAGNVDLGLLEFD